MHKKHTLAWFLFGLGSQLQIVASLSFTELFVFDDEDADSIVSVLEVLETMDEDGVVVSEDEFSEMIASLNSNTEYAPL